MARMDLGNEKQMSTNVATKVILRFSDLASAEKSVKKQTHFFLIVKRAHILVNLFSMIDATGMCHTILETNYEKIYLLPNTRPVGSPIVCIIKNEKITFT